MEYLIIGILIAIIIIILTFRIKKIEKAYLQTRQRQLEHQLANRMKEKLDAEIQVEKEINNKNITLNTIKESIANLTAQRENMQNNLQAYEKDGLEQLNRYLANLKKEKIKNVELKIQEERAVMIQETQKAYQQEVERLEDIRKITQKEVDELITTLEAYRAKQETINKEILRQRELEEKTNFYRVCLPDEAIADITELQIVRQKLKKPEILDKIIYDTYVAKPVLEMVKRVLQNSTCSGIYKITCQETKEIYIGKSTDIKNRWQQHCKTAFNCGTIASSLLHRKMQQYGIENFTFELLETVPKDKLSEREKFYIDFYKTKETGLNERNG